MSEGWDQAEGLRLRRYSSYEDYRQHQAAKLRTLNLTKYSDEFKKALAGRLKFLPKLQRGATVLCLGARNGTECEVFIERGFFAVGVDLNPGADNKTVLFGDFHHLQFADETVDVVFTNALDHVFDLDKALGEIKRVLKPNGLLVAEIVRGSKDEEGREPGAFESAWWDTADTVVERIQKHDLALWERIRFSYPWNGDQCIFGRH